MHWLILFVLINPRPNLASNDLHAATVHITKNADTTETSGTGFLVEIRGFVYLILPKHLVGHYDPRERKMTSFSGNLVMVMGLKIKHGMLTKTVIKIPKTARILPHPNPFLDLALINLAEVQKEYPQILSNALSLGHFLDFESLPRLYSYRQGDEVEVLGFPGEPPHAFIPVPVYTRIGSIPGEEVEIKITASNTYKGKFYTLSNGIYPGHSGAIVLIRKGLKARGNPDALPPPEDQIIGMIFGGLGPDSPFAFALSSDYIIEFLQYVHTRILHRKKS